MTMYVWRCVGCRGIEKGKNSSPCYAVDIDNSMLARMCGKTMPTVCPWGGGNVARWENITNTEAVPEEIAAKYMFKEDAL